ncbi:hypothetical protein D5086_010982 [Populus alba]|uniref:Uncharacterized protein n=1 Tax=Populus alba TaxID=43335 RepID=A0ACC4CAX6_POPAL
MGSRGRPVFDLNEPPTEDDEIDHAVCLQPHKALPSANSHPSDMFVASMEIKVVEREEGEWSDAEDTANVCAGNSMHEKGKASQFQGMSEVEGTSVMVSMNVSSSVKVIDNTKAESCDRVSPGLDQGQNDYKNNGSRNSNGNANDDVCMDGQEEIASVPNNVKLETMLINIDEVKQAGIMKSSTPRRQPNVMRTVKEVRTVPQPAERSGERPGHPLKDQKQADLPCNDVGFSVESCTPKSESNGDINSAQPAKNRKVNGDSDFPVDTHLPPIQKQSTWKQPAESSWKHPADLRQPKNSQFSKQEACSYQPRFHGFKVGKQEIPSCEKVDWSQYTLSGHISGTSNTGEDSELQCVPGRFESVEEYVRVFEPLLFEECRAQLYSTWEESAETNAHIMVRIKSIERRERGWYDVIVLPANECKWTFKEGDVAVLSTPRPGTVRSKRNNTSSSNEDDEEPDINGRVAGTVRRHIPLDSRDPPGAILHFFVGDSYDPHSKVDEDHILRKLQPRGTWYLTVLGSLATTQREYVALHAFCRLNLQMQAAILKPSSDHFPKYEQQTPAMPECFTQNFVDHLRRTFNGPQLAAIQWAATHTAAGTSSGVTKRQEPWPFTLVQGPPGTGKTHTVWGMLNVIHLVQYQHYYTSLLKKLAPQSYKQANESNSDNIALGSIDEVLHNMDQNLFRSLSKLCPKPRMLVCAPSNAATDELLARVLDRGFIDGEMKVYRPDVARVGVDSQSRAAQAVSVERRTEQLLIKSPVDGRSQGSVGVDPDVLMARDQNRDALLQNLAAAVESRDKVLVEISRLLILEPRFRAGSNFNLEEARASLEASFANEAEIVFTTVSSSGRKLFSRLTHGFDMQLPATVISKAAGTLLYSRSLFERFQQAGCPTMLLSVQYRMHPQIRDFPSRYFYQGRLTDSESVATLPDETYYKDPLLRPYLFYDVTHGRESHRGGSVSYQNIHEAQFCLQLYEHLQKSIKSLGMGRITVGIITPYKLQLKCLQQEFSSVLKSEEGKDIYINTVDAFQGQERDVIIMSCVRASNHGVGFVADIRRMNVALTRAKRALWVMGNATSLVQSDDWSALVADAKARNCYMNMDSLPKDFFVLKGTQGKGSSNVRGLRLGGPRHRSLDMHMESRSGTPSEDDENSGASVISRNGSCGPFKPPMDNSLDDFDQSGDRSRDAWQYGIQKKQDLFGQIDSCDICKEMGVLLGRLWQIIPLTDQLPGSKLIANALDLLEYQESVGGIKELFAYLVTMSSRIASHRLGSLSISVVRQRVHILKMLCTLFGRAKYSLKGLRYWMVKPKSSFFLFFLEGIHIVVHYDIVMNFNKNAVGQRPGSNSGWNDMCVATVLECRIQVFANQYSGPDGITTLKRIKCRHGVPKQCPGYKGDNRVWEFRK